MYSDVFNLFWLDNYFILAKFVFWLATYSILGKKRCWLAEYFILGEIAFWLGSAGGTRLESAPGGPGWREAGGSGWYCLCAYIICHMDAAGRRGEGEGGGEEEGGQTYLKSNDPTT